MKLQNKMKVLLLTGVIFSAQALAQEAVIDENVAQSRKMVKEFATTLKAELMGAMKEGGALKAIDACHIKSPAIASSVSENNQVTIRRTSTKLRNPDNKADQWEEKVLSDFAAKKANGESLEQMEFSEMIEHDGKKQFRYMKAIAVGEKCLTCHGGDNVKAEVANKIKQLYPNDQARFYQIGDLRGAFSISKDL